MMKLLVLVLVVGIAYLAWRYARIAERDAAPPPAQPGAGGDGQPQAMVQCATCAVHLPRADAVPGAGGRLYCSQEHRLAGDAGKR